MEEIKKISFFASYGEALQSLDDRSAGQLIKAMCSYAFDGKEPDKLSSKVKPMWLLVKPNLDSSLKKIKGGRKGGKQNAS